MSLKFLKKPNKSNWRFIKKKSGGGVLITQTSHLIYIMQKFLENTSRVMDYVEVFTVMKMRIMHI